MPSSNFSSASLFPAQFWQHVRIASLALQEAIDRDRYAFKVLEAASLPLAISREMLRKNELDHRLYEESIQARKSYRVDEPLARGFRPGWTLRDQRRWQWLQEPTSEEVPQCRVGKLLSVLCPSGEEAIYLQLFRHAQGCTEVDLARQLIVTRDAFTELLSATQEFASGCPDRDTSNFRSLFRRLQKAIDNLYPLLPLPRPKPRPHQSFIRMPRDPAAEQIESDFITRFRYLSGSPWPPRNSAEWTTVLVRAGFSEQRIEQFLSETGNEGFAECGRLPKGYVSTGGDDSPTFTTAMMAGLERRKESELAVKSNEAMAKRVETALNAIQQPLLINDPQQTSAPKQPRNKTAPGDAKAKLIAALTTWHQYSNGGCDRTDSIGVRRLAEMAKVSPGAASLFFKKQFESHNAYKRACAEPSILALQLKSLNGELQPRQFNRLLHE